MLSFLPKAFGLRSRFFPYLRDFGLRAAISRSWIEFRKLKNRTFSEIKNLEWQNLFELNPEVLVVTNDPHSPSHQYRVQNTVTALWMLGMNSAWINRATFKSLKVLPRNVRIVILWRTSEQLETYPSFNHENGIIYIYDIDDLTFESSAYNLGSVHGLQLIPSSAAKSLMGPVLQSQRELISQVSAFTAPTKVLLDSASLINQNVSLWPNVLAPSDLELSSQLFLDKMKSNASGLTIGYASGSKTHNEDFASIEEPLGIFLTQKPDSKIEILGLLDLPKKLQSFYTQGRIVFKPLVKQEELLQTMKGWDINLAPLVLPNKFNDAKSELKWVHSGVLGIPIIASASRSFAEVIEDGVTGFLATSTQDWINALQILSDKIRRELVGSKARDRILETRTIESLAGAIHQTLSKMNAQSLKGAARPVKTIAWVLPNLPTGSGGHRNVFRLANSAGVLGYESIVVISNSHLGNSIDDFARKHYGDGHFKVTEDIGVIGEVDFAVATHHSTVDLVSARAHQNSKLGYVVQDFEPWFYPMGQQYLEALATYYRSEFNVICSGKWMSEKVKEVRGHSVPFFEFPLDRAIYFPNDELKQGVVFFAKPDTPRRLFELGIESLRLVRKVLPAARISLFGASEKQLEQFRDEFDVVGKLPTIQEVGDLYRSHQVGMAFSTSNPSLVPVEMMACGLPVLDISNEVTKRFYPDFISENLLPEVNSSEIASKLVKLLCNNEFRRLSSNEGIAFAESFPTTEMMIPIVKDWISNAK
jgi:glycosyltransferase involved in cell wall biosynthesis